MGPRGYVGGVGDDGDYDDEVVAASGGGGLGSYWQWVDRARAAAEVVLVSAAEVWSVVGGGGTATTAW